MSEVRKQIISVLRITSKILESLTENQCNNILSGKGKLVYEDISKGTNKPKVENTNLELYISKIQNFGSREDVFNFIQELNLKKVELAGMAKLLEIHLNKGDKKDIIVKKIIESTVGNKLRADAIKNVDLKENK